MSKKKVLFERADLPDVRNVVEKLDARVKALEAASKKK